LTRILSDNGIGSAGDATGVIDEESEELVEDVGGRVDGKRDEGLTKIVTRCVYTLPFEGGVSLLAAANLCTAPKEAAGGNLHRAGIEEDVYETIYRFVQRAEEHSEANVVESTIRRRDETVFSEILSSLDPENFTLILTARSALNVLSLSKRVTMRTTVPVVSWKVMM